MFGPRSYEETQQWLAHAEIGLLPLIDTENNRNGMPNKLFEYSLFGLPIVATDLGRVAEIVRSTTAGILVPPESGMLLSEALAHLHTNEQERRALSAASLRASKEFTFASEFTRLCDLYSKIEATA